MKAPHTSTWSITLHMSGNQVVKATIEGRPDPPSGSHGLVNAQRIPNHLAFLPDPPTRILLCTPGWDDSGYPRPTSHGLDAGTALKLLGQLIGAIAQTGITPQAKDEIRRQNLQSEEPNRKLPPAS